MNPSRRIHITPGSSADPLSGPSVSRAVRIFVGGAPTTTGYDRTIFLQRATTPNLPTTAPYPLIVDGDGYVYTGGGGLWGIASVWGPSETQILGPSTAGTYGYWLTGGATYPFQIPVASTDGDSIIVPLPQTMELARPGAQGSGGEYPADVEQVEITAIDSYAEDATITFTRSIDGRPVASFGFHPSDDLGAFAQANPASLVPQVNGDVSGFLIPAIGTLYGLYWVSGSTYDITYPTEGVSDWTGESVIEWTFSITAGWV